MQLVLPSLLIYQHLTGSDSAVKFLVVRPGLSYLIISNRDAIRYIICIKEFLSTMLGLPCKENEIAEKEVQDTSCRGSGGVPKI